MEMVRQPALEVIRTISFLQLAADIWRTDKKIVAYLRMLRNSPDQKLLQIADGMLWRLEDESAFRLKVAQKRGKLENFTNMNDDSIEENYHRHYVRLEKDGVEYVKMRENLTSEELQKLEQKRVEQGNIERKAGKPPTYDIMISYCQKNADICYLIHDCLMETKTYTNWIDKNKMFGSLTQRTAKGIEESDFIIVCISSDYCKSQPCQSEAEYAYKQKRRIIFIKVEPKYTPNGWLGLLLGNNHYTDFTKKDFSSAIKELFTQIHLHRKTQNIDLTVLDSVN